MKILQLKISLLDIKPEIWRRIEVEEKSSFHELHEIIQTVMGWDNAHLYSFEFNKNERISDEEAGNIIISEKLIKEKQKFKYIYDFGDDWEHAIVVEKISVKQAGKNYPLCTDGEMNCPPEDCGGAWSFRELMKIVKNKNHPEYEERMEWLGDDYDPEYFNMKEVNLGLDELFG